jgi:opacity protein-like surface antigen
MSVNPGFKKIFLSCIVALFLFGLAASAANVKVVIKVKAANVRLRPALESSVIGRALLGQIFEVQKKIAGWYLVQLPPDPNGSVLSGYLHNSVVKELEDQAIVPKTGEAEKEKPTPPEKPTAAVKPQAQKELAAKKAEAESGSPRKKFFIRMGGGYGSKSFGYDNSWSFSVYQENGQVTEKYSTNASGAAFDIGVGFMFTPSMGAELSFVPASGKTKGTFSSSFPHPFYFEFSRTKAWEKTGLKYSASELNLDFLYYLPLTQKFNLYLMAGGTYFMDVKIENLKVINWSESGYPYLDLNVTPEYASYSKSCFGFNGGAGLDFMVKRNIGINLNARYSSGQAKIKAGEAEFSIQAGGLRATAGIKLAF